MGSVDHSGDGPDVLDAGTDRPLLGRSVRWVVAATLVGLLVGYAVGHHRAEIRTVRTTGPAPAVTHRAGVPATGPPFVQTGAVCSVQHGHRLQLGVQVENQTTSIVHVTGVGSREPLPGIRPLATRVGVCGQISGLPVDADPSAVPAGRAIWLTATVQVLVRCPAPDPVQFVVHFGEGLHADAERLAGFVDLTYVPYTGCDRS